MLAKDMLDFQDKVVIITGASGGIGAGLAQGFAQAGAQLVLHGHTHTPQMPESAAGKTGSSSSITTDLTAADGPQKVMQAALEAFGQVDVLINNAAIQPVEPLASLSDQSWQQLLDVNLTAAHRLTQAFAAQVMSQQTGGCVIHIASIEGLQPALGHSHYATAKAALIMHARAAAGEYGQHGIRVNSVSPGLIERLGLAEQWPEGVKRWLDAVPLKRLGTPADIANACLFLASPLASWITGANLVVDGGVLSQPTW